MTDTREERNGIDTVRFHIVRKRAFAGCALRYSLYINGECVGKLWNGGTLDVVVPRVQVYLISDVWMLRNSNGYLRDDGSEEYHIVIGRRGGFRTLSNMELFRLQNGRADKLPSFNCDRYIAAMYNEADFAAMTDCERVLVRCLEFF